MFYHCEIKVKLNLVVCRRNLAAQKWVLHSDLKAFRLLFVPMAIPRIFVPVRSRTSHWLRSLCTMPTDSQRSMLPCTWSHRWGMLCLPSLRILPGKTHFALGHAPKCIQFYVFFFCDMLYIIWTISHTTRPQFAQLWNYQTFVCVARIGGMYRKARKVLHPDTGEAGTSPPSCQRDVWSSLADGSRMTTKDGLKP